MHSRIVFLSQGKPLSETNQTKEKQMNTIHTATKRITYQGLDAFLPVLIEQDKDSKTDLTIKKVHISTSDPLANKQTALKYANAWRNEWLAAL